jgi:hypothetical protein
MSHKKKGRKVYKKRSTIAQNSPPEYVPPDYASQFTELAQTLSDKIMEPSNGIFNAVKKTLNTRIAYGRLSARLLLFNNLDDLVRDPCNAKFIVAECRNSHAFANMIQKEYWKHYPNLFTMKSVETMTLDELEDIASSEWKNILYDKIISVLKSRLKPDCSENNPSMDRIRGRAAKMRDEIYEATVKIKHDGVGTIKEYATNILNARGNRHVSKYPLSIPGGRIKRNGGYGLSLPNIINAALVEMAEETHITPNQYKILTDIPIIHTHYVDGVAYETIMLFAVGNVEGINPRIEPRDERQTNEIRGIFQYSVNDLDAMCDKGQLEHITSTKWWPCVDRCVEHCRKYLRLYTNPEIKHVGTQADIEISPPREPTPQPAEVVLVPFHTKLNPGVDFIPCYIPGKNSHSMEFIPPATLIPFHVEQSYDYFPGPEYTNSIYSSNYDPDYDPNSDPAYDYLLNEYDSADIELFQGQLFPPMYFAQPTGPYKQPDHPFPSIPRIDPSFPFPRQMGT